MDYALSNLRLGRINRTSGQTVLQHHPSWRRTVQQSKNSGDDTGVAAASQAPSTGPVSLLRFGVSVSQPRVREPCPIGAPDGDIAACLAGCVRQAGMRRPPAQQSTLTPGKYGVGSSSLTPA